MTQVPTNPNKVTMADAYDHASLKTGTKAADDVEITPILNGADTVMYLVNYDEGWEVLSGDRRAPEVLMMCDAGNVTAESLNFNEAQSNWLSVNSDGIKFLLDNPDYVAESDNDSEASPASDLPWTLVSTTYKTASDSVIRDHMLATKWGQGSPWNSKMPYKSSAKTSHCVAGCVPVAWGQLLYYFHFKTGIPEKSYAGSTCTAYLTSTSSILVLTSSDVSFPSASKVSPVWNYMPLTNSSSNSDTEYGYVSTLLLRLGYLFGSRYGYSSTGTAVSSSMIQTIVNEYSLGCTYASYDDDVIAKWVRGGSPVIAGIYCSSGGHAVVIDGYRKLTKSCVKLYVRGNDYGQTETKEETTTTTEDYFAINWGWDGTGDSSDGSTIWYNAEDDWSPTSSYTFTSKSSMFYGFTYRKK